MGAVISALLLGGGLAGAFFVWLLRGHSGDQDAGTAEERELSPEGAAAAAQKGDEGEDGRDTVSPKHEQMAQVREQRSAKKAAGEHHQESNGHLVLEFKSSDVEGPTGKRPGLYSEALSSESPELSPPADPLKGQETISHSVIHSSGKFLSDSLLVNKHEEHLKTQRVAGIDLVDHEDWENVPGHSVWRDADKGKIPEPSHAGAPVLELQTSSPSHRLDYGRDSLKDAKGQESQLKTKRVAAVCPLSHQVTVQFQVHYVTMSDTTIVAVTGDHESLGSWHSYIPLQCGKDWFWSISVPLPMDTALKWKFVVVENGSIARWEECSNRLLETGREDITVHKWWGYH